MPNPYPGPRSFQRGERLYGRERETFELLDLLIAERIVLLYSPSGAGKTSLLQAALIPELEREGFRVVPPLRVGLPVDADLPHSNRYVLSTLQTLDEARSASAARSSNELARFSLDGYLAQSEPTSGELWHGDVLIFDQFEEILTVDPNDRAGKVAFFDQVGEALRDRNRWALFAMREEFVAALDPYLRPIPTRFDKGRRYRLDLLGPMAARQAMQEPARAAGVDFSDAAAAKLIDDLRAVLVQQPDGSTVAALGNAVEPVQLQVVCRRLWDGLRPGDTVIDVEDVRAVGDVDAALRGYYADTVAGVAVQTQVRERSIRQWFDTQLINEQGMRGQVLQGLERSKGLDNRAIWPLVDAHLVRAEQRRGATWFELSHDRLVEPLRGDNAAWREAHFTPFQRQAALWEETGRPEGVLLSGESLRAAEQWAAAPEQPLELHEQAFLAASVQARTQAIYRARQARRIRWLAAVLAVIAVLAVAASIVAWRSGQVARSRELAAAAVASTSFDPQRSILLALESLKVASSDLAVDALHQALEASRIEAVLRGHDGEVSDVAYSPDGRLLASAGFDGTLRLWDVESHELLQTMANDGGQLYGVAWDSAGQRLATIGLDGAARLWDATSGQLIDRFQAHSAAGNSIAWSPDDRFLATGGDDGWLYVWDATTLDLVQKLQQPDQMMVNQISFSPDGEQVAAALYSPPALQAPGVAVVWDVLSGEPRLSLAGHSDSVFDVAWSPRCVAQADGSGRGCVNLLATASADGTARIWNADSGELRHVLMGHGGWVQDVAFSPDGQQLATSSWDRTAKVWNASTGRELYTLSRHEGWLRALEFQPTCQPAAGPDGPMVCGAQLASAGEDGVRLWNTGLSKELRSFVASGQPVRRLAFDPAGERLATAADDGSVTVWDPASNTPLLSVTHQAPVRDVAWSPDGRRFASGGDDRRVLVWDAATGEQLLAMGGMSGVVTGIAWSPDGRRLAASSSDRTARIWDVATGLELSLLEGHTSRINNVAWSPDSQRVATSGGDHSARLWDAETGALLATLAGHTAEVYFVAWSPDGSTLATASVDQTVKLWDAASGQELRTLRGHGNRVQGAAFSPDSRHLVTTSWDRTARLWDVRSGDLLATLPGHTARVFHVAYSPSGNVLASAGEDGTVRIYAATQDKLTELARQRLTRPWTREECQVYLRRQSCRTMP